MTSKSHRMVKKLSSARPDAALSVTAERLYALRTLTNQSAEIGEELSHIVADLRQVAAPPYQPFIFTTSLTQNEHLLREVFRDCDDVIFRQFTAGKYQALLIYIDGLTDKQQVEKNVLEMLMAPENNGSIIADADMLAANLVTAAQVSVISQANHAIEDVMTGSALLVVDGMNKVLSISATKHVKRSVEEAQSETVVSGPHDGFNETLNDNIVLIRRRARDPDIKVCIIKLGERTKTSVAVIYAASLVKPGLVEEVKNRLRNMNVGEVHFSAQIEEALSERPWSPFPQTQATERPDKLLSAIYEGRVAIIVDNTPYAIAVPCTYGLLMQSPEDYTLQPVVASLIRFTRHVSSFLAIYLPAIYISIVSYHPGMLPISLAISIAELRARTPFPSILEAIMMEALVEIFQEAIMRLPTKLSGAAGVVGALVIGTTVVQAGLANPLLVVVIATTAIASYSMTSFNFSMGLRVMRVPMLILASIFGLYGVMLGLLAITIHLCSLRNFGESYLGGLFNLTLLEDWKDGIVRLPAEFLRVRPKEFGPQERTRAGGKDG